MKQALITFFNPTTHSVDELRGALVKFDRQYFWLCLDDRTVAIARLDVDDTQSAAGLHSIFLERCPLAVALLGD